MYQCINYCLLTAKCKVHGFFERVFKENAGAAELIATLVIIGIVLAVALIFRNQLSDIITNLWNKLVRDGDTSSKNSSDIVNDWGVTGNVGQSAGG